MSKKRQQTEQGANDEAESSERPCQASEMLLTVGGYVDRFNVTRNVLNQRKGAKFNIDTFRRQEVDHTGNCMTFHLGHSQLLN
jgi:hypothetical protein